MVMIVVVEIDGAEYALLVDTVDDAVEAVSALYGETVFLSIFAVYTFDIVGNISITAVYEHIGALSTGGREGLIC